MGLVHPSQQFGFEPGLVAPIDPQRHHTDAVAFQAKVFHDLGFGVVGNRDHMIGPMCCRTPEFVFQSPQAGIGPFRMRQRDGIHECGQDGQAFDSGDVVIRCMKQVQLFT